MYELATHDSGMCLVLNNHHIPLDLNNMDCYEYMLKVNAGEIEDVLPKGKLDELKGEL